MLIERRHQAAISGEAMWAIPVSGGNGDFFVFWTADLTELPPASQCWWPDGCADQRVGAQSYCSGAHCARVPVYDAAGGAAHAEGGEAAELRHREGHSNRSAYSDMNGRTEIDHNGS